MFYDIDLTSTHKNKKENKNVLCFYSVIIVFLVANQSVHESHYIILQYIVGEKQVTVFPDSVVL